MGLSVRFGVERRHRGPLSSWNQRWRAIGTKEDRDKLLGKRASFNFNRARKKAAAYGGEEIIFRPERNVVR